MEGPTPAEPHSDGQTEAAGAVVEGGQGVTTARARLTWLGRLVAGVAISACLAIALLSILWIANGGSEGLVIAIASIPLVLALVAVAWPSARLRQAFPSIKLPDTPTVPLDAHDDTLGELLEVARHQAKIEEDLIASTSARAGWLLGFAGVILALAGAQAQNVFKDAASLGTVGRPLGAWFLVGAAVMTAVAAACALQALLPRPSTGITPIGLAAFLEARTYSDSRANVRYAQLKVMIEQIETDRVSNERRLDWLGAGFVTLLLALVFLLLHVGVFLERTVEAPCSGSVSQSTEATSGASSRLARALPTGTPKRVPVADGRRPADQITAAIVVSDPNSGARSTVDQHFAASPNKPPAVGSAGSSGARGPPCFPTEPRKK